MDKDVLKRDLYGVFGVPSHATEKEIVSAYRKRARKCHPDKNPDDPKAAEEFHKLSQALEILTDAAARAAYDKLLRSRKAAEERNEALDDKRKKFKDELELRENAAREDNYKQEMAAKNLHAEIERLREQGSQLLREEQERIKREMEEATFTEIAELASPKLKIRWCSKKRDLENGGYSHDSLMQILSMYGEVNVLLMSGKKRGSAIVEFKDTQAAVRAVTFEKGLIGNPLSFTWLSGKPGMDDSRPGAASSESASYNPNQPSLVSDTDYENLVLTKLRQAEERKRLTQELFAQDRLVDESTASDQTAINSDANTKETMVDLTR